MEYHKEHGANLKEYYCNYALKDGYMDTCKVVTEKINKISRKWDEPIFICNNCLPMVLDELEKKDKEDLIKYTALNNLPIIREGRKQHKKGKERNGIGRGSKPEKKKIKDEMEAFIFANAEKYTCNELYTIFFKKYGVSYSRPAIREKAAKFDKNLKPDIRPKRSWGEVF